MTVRTSSIPLYVEIVREHSEELAALETQVLVMKAGMVENTAVDGNPLPVELISLENRLAKHCLAIILFTATSVEAYIYDYAARRLSDKYAQEYVDKLDVVGKWVVVPRLVTGKELDRSKKWYGLMKNLVKARNQIVHSKSSEMPYTREEAQHHLEKLENASEQFVQTAKSSVELLDHLVNEIGQVDPDESIWINSYFVRKP